MEIEMMPHLWFGEMRRNRLAGPAFEKKQQLAKFSSSASDEGHLGWVLWQVRFISSRRGHWFEARARSSRCLWPGPSSPPSPGLRGFLQHRGGPGGGWTQELFFLVDKFPNQTTHGQLQLLAASVSSFFLDLFFCFVWNHFCPTGILLLLLPRAYDDDALASASVQLALYALLNQPFSFSSMEPNEYFTIIVFTK